MLKKFKVPHQCAAEAEALKKGGAPREGLPSSQYNCSRPCSGSSRTDTSSGPGLVATRWLAVGAALISVSAAQPARNSPCCSDFRPLK